MKGTKKTLNAHHRSSKAYFIIYKMLLQILVARFTMREQERGKQMEKFWHNRLAMKIDEEMRRRDSLLSVRKRRDPTWMSSKCHPSMGEGSLQRGRTFRVSE
jgi:hypothetical protein